MNINDNFSQSSNSFSSLYREMHHNDILKIASLSGLLIISLFIALSAGDIWLWPNKWFTTDGYTFICQLRLPRILAVVVTGAALAVSGATMQSLFNNSLADPGLLGVSNGAGVALVLTFLTGNTIKPQWLMNSIAITGALVTCPQD